MTSAGSTHFDARDRPLRRDLGMPGALLGQLLRELAPPGVFESVEAARLSARRRRKGDSGASAQLEELPDSLAPAEALEIVRAFSAYFGVVNTAEQVHRMRAAVDYARAGRLQPGSLGAAAREPVRRGTSAEEVANALGRLLVEPVFMAHPTEAVRRTLLKKDQRLAQALVERFAAPAMNPAALERLDARIALEVAPAWQTEEQLPGETAPRTELEIDGLRVVVLGVEDR